jgi:hypothetical protein
MIDRVRNTNGITFTGSDQIEMELSHRCKVAVISRRCGEIDSGDSVGRGKVGDVTKQTRNNRNKRQ